jgi:HK97 family phage prohead protease
MIYRIANGEVERCERAPGLEPETERFIVEGWASTRDPDLDEFVIEPESFRESLPAFERNPVLLFNHDRDKVIGRVRNPKIEERGLRIQAEFDLGDPLGSSKAGQVERGFLKGFSVGFRAIDEPKMSEGKLFFPKNQLLEVSLVSIPANPHALIGAGADEEATLTRILAEAQAKIRPSSGEVQEILERLTALEGGQEERLPDEERIARMIQARLGTVRELVREGVRRARENDDLEGAALELENASRALRGEELVERLIKPTVDISPGTGGQSGGGDGGEAPEGKPFSPPSTPGAGPSEGGGKVGKRPLEGSLVPDQTPADSRDGHKHKIRVLIEDGTGETLMAGGQDFLPHAHEIANWQVVKLNVAGRESEHPGNLFPGEQLTATQAIEKLAELEDGDELILQKVEVG